MPVHHAYDAVVVGSGPNGLAAAITMARAGRSVLVLEAKDTIGGGTRTQELTLPGFQHDVCSAIHPLGIASPFFRSLPLEKYGLDWIEPPVAMAHPLDDGSAAVLLRSLNETSALLGEDGTAYRRLFEPMVEKWETVMAEYLGPIPIPLHDLPLHLQFGIRAMWPARLLAGSLFRGQHARALFAGLSAHSILPLEKLISASFGIMLGLLGHSVGWPVPRGGSQSITCAMAAYLAELGGEIQTSFPVTSLDDLPSTKQVLFDVTPRQLVQIAGERLPSGYRRKLLKYRHGAAAFKVDWALSEPIPWKAEACRQAGTVHVGGTFDEVVASESAVGHGRVSEKPFVLFAQQSLFDPGRAPEGKHTGWGYCHVPNGSTVDMTERIEAQIERFAPGFRDCILERHVFSPVEMEAYNPNYIGGDINGGIQDWSQLWFRPTVSLKPYITPAPGIFLCSSSTPPGGGVHGMCGYHAANAALSAKTG